MKDKNIDTELTVENFRSLLKEESDYKLDNFIENILTIEEHSILGICRYILNHKEEWQELLNELQPFLSEYGLAYEDSKDLNIEGENFLIIVIENEVEFYDYQEYRERVGW